MSLRYCLSWGLWIIHSRIIPKHPLKAAVWEGVLLDGVGSLMLVLDADEEEKVKGKRCKNTIATLMGSEMRSVGLMMEREREIEIQSER